MEVSDILFSRLYQAFFLSFVVFQKFFTSLVELGRLTKIGQATYDLLLNFFVYQWETRLFVLL